MTLGQLEPPGDADARSPTSVAARHLIRAETAQRIRSGMREAQNETERLLGELLARRPPAAGGAATPCAAVRDAAELVLLVRFELAVLMEDLATPRGALRANFYARMLLHTVHESALTLPRLLGHPLREALAAAAPHREAELEAVHARIHRLTQRCEEEYGDAHDGLLAHRSETAERRIASVGRIGGPCVLDLALELSHAITDVLQVMLPLLDPASRPTLLPLAWQG